MKEERYFYAPDALNSDSLPEEEAIHAQRVLRLKEGNTIHLLDGKGTHAEARITLISNKHCRYEIEKTERLCPTWDGHIHLAIAPTKDIGRIEWLAEKATEIGFNEITFLKTKNSERKIIKTQRIERIIIAAMKQSRKAVKPIVNEMIDFEDFLKKQTEKQNYICHCHTEILRNHLKNLLPQTQHLTHDRQENFTLLIGPEGDFTKEETLTAIETYGHHSVHLGESRLRTETAALSALFIANLKRSL